MLIFWQECKHILRSKFFWCVVVLGFAFAAFVVTSSLGSELDSYSINHVFVEEHGTSFTEKDAVAYVDYCLEHTYVGKGLKEDLKQMGIEITAQEILAYHKGEETELGKKLEKFRQEAETEDEQVDYDNYVGYLSQFENPFKIVESREFSDHEEGSQREELLQYLKEILPEWKVKLLQKGYEDLDKRAEEIAKTGESQYLLPFSMYMTANYLWFDNQFTQQSAMGSLWAVAFVLAGIAAARSLGGSLMGNMPEMMYTGKKGRKLSLYKILAVLAVSGGTYLVFYLLATVLYLFLFRLDLYWDIPLSAVVSDLSGPVVPRISITIGGYWWFQLGVGLAAVLIMALIFCAAMALTKNFYAGSAISVGVSLLLLGLVQLVPDAQNSFLLMGSPIGLYLKAGAFLQDRFCRFYILPHFEGVMLLVWCGIAAILATVGFMRFRKSAL